MGNYIDEAGDDIRRRDEENRRKVEIIRQTKFWASLVQQLYKDVEQIHQNSRLREKLDGLELEVIPYAGSVRVDAKAVDVNGYEVIKHNDPQVKVGIRHEGSHFMIDRKFYARGSTKIPPERLDIKDREGTVFLLTSSGDLLGIPGAIKYLLQPVMDILKED